MYGINEKFWLSFLEAVIEDDGNEVSHSRLCCLLKLGFNLIFNKVDTQKRRFRIQL